jgi:hypothetical protein
MIESPPAIKRAGPAGDAAARRRGARRPRCRGRNGQGCTRRAMEALGGRGSRLALLTASLLCGLVIALLTVHLAGPWQQ